MTKSVRFDLVQNSEQDSNTAWTRFSGTRNPDLSVNQRKMIRIFAYLGMNVYLYLNERKRRAFQLYQSLHLHRLRQNESRNTTVEFCRIIDDRMQLEARKFDDLQAKMTSIWNYLLKLAIDFEHIHPDGTDFVRLLAGIDDSEVGDDVTPVANISVSSSFEDS